jgi:hypothetical protein
MSTIADCALAGADVLANIFRKFQLINAIAESFDYGQCAMAQD